MFLNSMKQLFRRPGKALVFFLLLAASTALLSFAAVSAVETGQRISAAEGQFSTIATVSQNMQPGDGYLFADMLEYEGAEYVLPPEIRPHFLAYTEELYPTIEQYQADGIHVVTFTALEDCNELDKQVPIRIEEAFYNKFDTTAAMVMGYGEQELLPGDQVLFFQIFDLTPLEAGKKYIASLFFMSAEENSWSVSEDGYCADFAPFSTQYNPGGTAMDGTGRMGRVEEVTGNFWDEGGRGSYWLTWVEALRMEKNTSPLPVLPTESLSLLPTFHSRKAYISNGREITPEEFSEGARVCILPRELMKRNFLSVGDRIRLPMRTALYGFEPNRMNLFHFNLSYSFTPMNAQGELYDIFWDGEYEIVGEYRELEPGATELYYDMIIVPAKSVGGSWDDNIAYYGPMNPRNTSFQIPNGSIAEFNTALHRAVPRASRLEIVYDDNGYEEVMQSLKNARLSSLLLLGVGALSTLTVIVLLMYFFVIRERRRTAIERSFGLSKAWCRASIMSGILVLSLPAAALGSLMSWTMANAEAEGFREESAESSQAVIEDMSAGEEADVSMETAYFSREYSLWAENEHSSMDVELSERDDLARETLYFLVPLAVILCAAAAGLVMIEGGLRDDVMAVMGKGE